MQGDPESIGDKARIDARRARMAMLARADAGDLRRLWGGLSIDPPCEMLRGPETGLVTLRGRIGGGGSPFNLGEATVTRATVRLANGLVGHSIMLGHDKAKARLAAVIDALAEDSALGGRISNEILQPLDKALKDADARRRGEAAATQVEFFTMVRGEDE